MMQLTVQNVAVILAAIGAINWGLTALTAKAGKAPLNLVDKVLKPKTPMSWVPSNIAKIVYILVGAAGVFVLSEHLKAQKGFVQMQGRWM